MAVAEVPAWCYAELTAVPQVYAAAPPGSPTALLHQQLLYAAAPALHHQPVAPPVPAWQAGGFAQEHDAHALLRESLGIQPWEEADFGWLADAVLTHPLPPRWTSVVDEASGHTYYVDYEEQSSTWEHPWLPHCRRALDLGRAYHQQPTEGFFEELRGTLWHAHKEQLDRWHGPFGDAEGRQYFVNSVDGLSSWQDPRAETQHAYDLETYLLSTMEEMLPPPQPDTPGFGGNHAPLARRGLWDDAAAAASTATPASPRSPSSVATSHRRPSSARCREALQSHVRERAKHEQRSLMEHMVGAAEKLHGLQQDDEEAQRLAFAKKLADRRRRRDSSRGASAERVAATLDGPAEARPPPPPRSSLGAAALPPPTPALVERPRTPLGAPSPLLQEA